MNILTVKRLLAWVFTPLLGMAILLQPTLAAPIKVVVPNRLDGVEGETSANLSNFGSFRQQSLKLASEFTSLPETHRTITGFYSRPDYTVTQPSSATYADLVIWLSTTTASELTSAFSANYGAEVTKVFDGQLTISTQATGDPLGPRDFDYYFPFSRPYTYDLDAGNLLVEMASNSGPTGSLVLDSSNSSSALYVGAVGANASTGFVQNIAGANQFEFVPEPSSILLATLCVVGLGAHRIRRCA